MELVPRIRMDGDEPRAPEEVVICTPATTPSSALVASEDCTLAMSDDFTTVAEPVKDSFVAVPNAMTIVSSSAVASTGSSTLTTFKPAVAASTCL